MVASRRRDLLKITGAAAGTAALGNLTGPGAFPARAAPARQDAANAIIFGVGTDVDELDPRTTDTQEGYIVASNVYDCLVLYDLGATTIRPGLAESWEISEDGLVYTFNLRQGVSFHDGEPFNADAVITWYNSIDEEAPGHPIRRHPHGLRRGLHHRPGSTRVEAVDESTVRMTLPEPYAPLLANLAIPIAGIPSPAAIAQGLDHSPSTPPAPAHSGWPARMTGPATARWCCRPTRTTGAARRRSSSSSSR